MDKMNPVQEALARYRDTIGESFPVTLFMDTSPEQIVELIDRCIKEHKTATGVTGRTYSDKFVY